MELNKLTKKLISEGYTKDNPPSNFREWNDFYGGWQYTFEQERNIIVETPCGCVANASTVGTGTLMGYMGIEWCLENDNAVIACPFNKENCEKNNELLRSVRIGDCIQCATRIALESFDYDKSVEKIREQNKKYKQKLWNEFCRKLNGRACIHQCRYDNLKGEWSQRYNAIHCTEYACNYCTIKGRELSRKKGNVFYDLKITRCIPGEGFIPDEYKTIITRGKRFFDKNISMDIANVVAKSNQKEIIERERMKHSTDIFFNDYHGRYFKLEVINVRAETRESRDLEADLEAIANGIEVVHQSDIDVSKKVLKRERREKLLQNKVMKIKKTIVDTGTDVLYSDRLQLSRLEKLMKRGLITDKDIELWQKEYETNKIQTQMTIF